MYWSRCTELSITDSSNFTLDQGCPTRGLPLLVKRPVDRCVNYVIMNTEILWISHSNGYGALPKKKVGTLLNQWHDLPLGSHSLTFNAVPHFDSLLYFRLQVKKNIKSSGPFKAQWLKMARSKDSTTPRGLLCLKTEAQPTSGKQPNTENYTKRESPPLQKNILSTKSHPLH
jgi:hypothetical protein